MAGLKDFQGSFQVYNHSPCLFDYYPWLPINICCHYVLFLALSIRVTMIREITANKKVNNENKEKLIR